MTKLLNEQVIQQIQEVFLNLQEPVAMLFFGSQQNCQYCDETRQLAEEVAALSDKITLRVYDLEADAEVAQSHGVDSAPHIIMAAKDGDEIRDLGVHFRGIPSGHEFTSFIQAILIVSSRDSGLSEQTRAFLKALEKPVHLQVFVTPT
ncbi:MAG: hypothetical protein Kow002_20090 [Anaerolineales bacterium]